MNLFSEHCPTLLLSQVTVYLTVNGQQPDTVYLTSNKDNGITQWELEIIDYSLRPEEP